MTRAIPTTLYRQDGGYAAHGPGFYVWDEDPAEVVHAASALARGDVSVRPTQRFLAIVPQGGGGEKP